MQRPKGRLGVAAALCGGRATLVGRQVRRRGVHRLGYGLVDAAPREDQEAPGEDKKTEDQSVETKAQLTGEVKINFKSETFPLDKLAS